MPKLYSGGFNQPWVPGDAVCEGAILTMRSVKEQYCRCGLWRSNTDDAVCEGAILTMRSVKEQYWRCGLWRSNTVDAVCEGAILSMRTVKEQYCRIFVHRSQSWIVHELTLYLRLHLLYYYRKIIRLNNWQIH